MTLLADCQFYSLFQDGDSYIVIPNGTAPPIVIVWLGFGTRTYSPDQTPVIFESRLNAVAWGEANPLGANPVETYEGNI